MKLISLLITILGGVFFLIGYIISKISKNKNNSFKFSIALAFIVMIGLIIFDLSPELIENIEKFNLTNKIFVVLLSILGGMTLLKILDKLVPDHHHDHHEQEKNKEEHESNMYHIGLVTSIALILHNIIEGSAIYITSLVDIKTGLLIALGVGLHNIPLGIEISATTELSNRSKLKKFLPMVLMIFSTSLGALFIFLLNTSFNNLILSILIGITIGMLLYIVLFELLKEVTKNIKEKFTIIGIICGIIIIVINVII